MNNINLYNLFGVIALIITLGLISASGGKQQESDKLAAEYHQYMIDKNDKQQESDKLAAGYHQCMIDKNDKYICQAYINSIEAINNADSAQATASFSTGVAIGSATRR